MRQALNPLIDRPTPRSLAASILAVLLVISCVVVLTHGLGHLEHARGGSDHHACVFCSFAGGGVAPAETVPFLFVFPFTLLLPAAISAVPRLMRDALRLACTRGPPSF
jgi:hypothetical protein